MYEEDVTHPAEVQAHPASADHGPILRYLLLAVALIYVLASLYFMYTLKTRLDALDAKQQSLESSQADLTSRLRSTKSEFREALSSEVGMTKQELQKRAAELQQEQRNSAAKLTAAQTQQGQQIAAVNSQNRHHQNPVRFTGHQSETRAHHRRPRSAKRSDCPHLLRARNPQAQR